MNVVVSSAGSDMIQRRKSSSLWELSYRQTSLPTVDLLSQVAVRGLVESRTILGVVVKLCHAWGANGHVSFSMSYNWTSISYSVMYPIYKQNILSSCIWSPGILPTDMWIQYKCTTGNLLWIGTNINAFIKVYSKFEMLCNQLHSTEMLYYFETVNTMYEITV